MMMEFRSSSFPRRDDRVFMDSGSRYKKNYKPVFDKHGHFELEETESTDFYEYIQSFRESCDVKCIIQRFLKSGGTDITLLNRSNPIFMDVSELPDNARDWLNLSVYAQEQFLRLPTDVKEKFNNSFEQFLVSLGSDEFFKKLGVSTDVRKDNSGVSGTIEDSSGKDGEPKDGK